MIPLTPTAMEKQTCGIKRMSRIFQSFFLFVISGFFFRVEAQAGQILPPENFSLAWINDFEPQLSWAPPQHSQMDCRYEVLTSTANREDVYSTQVFEPLWKQYLVMEGGFLHFSVKTKCNGTESKPADFTIINPELVKYLQCYIQSSIHTHCFWVPASHATELNFFYELVSEDSSTSYDDKSPSRLQACPSYSYTDGVRTGCDLQANVQQDIHISFNGMLNNMLVRNTFKRQLIFNVRPPPLQWNVTKAGHKFIISWNPPDILHLSNWKFIINYTECNEIKFKDIFGKTSTELVLVSHCPYRMAIKAKKREEETPWSEEKYFDADSDPYAFVYAAIIIPLMFAGLAVLTFVCCRKNKDNIFPKVPKPRDLLSDISDNNNKSTFGNLYVPSDKEDTCEITLVIHPQNNKLNI